MFIYGSDYAQYEEQIFAGSVGANRTDGAEKKLRWKSLFQAWAQQTKI